MVFRVFAAFWLGALELKASTLRRDSKLAGTVTGACSRRGTDFASFRRSDNRTFQSDINLCDGDRLLPSVYILGAPKAATTSLAFDLGAGAGVHCAGGQKEWVFWTPGKLRTFGAGTSAAREEIRQQWLAGLPTCPTNGERQVAGDFSPQNLRQVARPLRRRIPAVLQRGDSVVEVARRAEGLPNALQSLYGPRVNEVTFVVMVREPLSRIVSHWYYFVKLRSQNFMAGVEAMLTGKSSDEQIWFGMYGHQMGIWLDVFHASQFYVIPYLAYGKGNTSLIAHDLAERMRYEMVDARGAAADKNGGTVSHPPLENITTPEFRLRFDGFMADDKARLISLLAHGHMDGMGLANYDGAVGNENDVKRWLEAWW